MEIWHFRLQILCIFPAISLWLPVAPSELYSRLYVHSSHTQLILSCERGTQRLSWVLLVSYLSHFLTELRRLVGQDFCYQYSLGEQVSGTSGSALAFWLSSKIFSVTLEGGYISKLNAQT